MSLRRLAIATLCLASSLCAMETGARKIGNIELIVGQYRTDIPGVPFTGKPTTFTQFIVGSADSSVTAFRVTIRFTENGVVKTKSALAEKSWSGYAWCAFEIEPANITSAFVEELHTSASQDF